MSSRKNPADGKKSATVRQLEQGLNPNSGNHHPRKPAIRYDGDEDEVVAEDWGSSVVDTTLRTPPLRRIFFGSNEIV